MARIFITGADGFVGRHLCTLALEQGAVVRGAVRQLAADAPAEVEWVALGDIGGNIDWRPVLEDVDAVVHLAGRAHVLRNTHVDPESVFRSVNVEGTERLAEAIIERGVRRLVFVSTIGVHGSFTSDQAFTESSPPHLHNSYTRSKWRAEERLRGLVSRGLELVIVRPALVYGPGVKGNLLRLLRWIDCGLPLPLDGVRNARSLLGVANLCDLLLRCAMEPCAAGEAFVAADETPLSTPVLVRALAAGLGRPARLVWAPPRLLGTMLGLLGHRRQWQQLAASLVVDASKSRAFFDHSYSLPTEAGLAETARWYRETH